MHEDLPFWKRKTLKEMTPEEWESLCDGCGRCCLDKLDHEELGGVVYTRVACHLLDRHSCRCRHYATRQEKVPNCVSLTPENVRDLNWLPPSCAYRLLANGEDLFWWHPLVSGDPESVHKAGISVREYAVSKKQAKGQYARFLLQWV